MQHVNTRYSKLGFAAAIIACAAALVLAMTVCTGAAFAKSKNNGLEFYGNDFEAHSLSGKTWDTTYKGEYVSPGEKYPCIYAGDMDSSGSDKITSAKSSNKKVATVKVIADKIEGKTYYSLKIYKKKAGTTTISYKLKGKKFKCKLKIYKHENPVSKFVIGKADISNQYKKTPYLNSQKISEKVYAQKNCKVTVKAKKNWKLKGIYVYNPDKMDVKKVKSGYKLKKGETVSYVKLKKNHSDVCETLNTYYFG